MNGSSARSANQKARGKRGFSFHSNSLCVCASIPRFFLLFFLHFVVCRNDSAGTHDEDDVRPRCGRERKSTSFRDSRGNDFPLYSGDRVLPALAICSAVVFVRKQAILSCISFSLPSLSLSSFLFCFVLFPGRFHFSPGHVEQFQANETP